MQKCLFTRSKNVDVLIIILLLNNTSRLMELDIKCSRSNPAPPVYLYSALVQLLSTLIVDEDITLLLRY